MINKKIEKYFGVVLLVLITILAIYKTTERNSLLEDGDYTLAYIYESKREGRRSIPKWKYSYYINGKTYSGSYGIQNPRKLEIGNYCIIYYSNVSPDLSKIDYRKSPLDIQLQLTNPEEVEAIIFDHGLAFQDTKEIHYKYSYKNKEYASNARLSDSILDSRKVNDSIIKVRISPEYPFINDLYFMSSHRKTRSKP